MVASGVLRESSPPLTNSTGSASLRTPLRLFLTSEHMQPASAESKLEPLRRLLDEGQITPEVYRRAKEKVLHAARTPAAQPQPQPEPELEPEHEAQPGAQFNWAATELRAALAPLSMGQVKKRAHLAGVDPARVDAAIDAARDNPKAAVIRLIEDALPAADSTDSVAASASGVEPGQNSGPIMEPKNLADTGSDIAASDAAFRTPISSPATPDRSNMSMQVEVDRTTHRRVAALEAVSSHEWQAMLTHKSDGSIERDEDQLTVGTSSTGPLVVTDHCGQQALVPEQNPVNNASATKSGTVGGEFEVDDDLESYVASTPTANVKIEPWLADMEESLLVRVESLDAAQEAMQQKEAELTAREQEVAWREVALKRREAALERRERSTIRKELALDQQRVLHAEEVAALGVRATNLRREQCTTAASSSELRLAQRSLREAQAALQAREQALAEHRERLLAEDFALNERAAEFPAVLETAKAEVAALRSQLSAVQQEQLNTAAIVAPGGIPPISPVTRHAAESMAALGAACKPTDLEGAAATDTRSGPGSGVAEEIEKVRQQMQEMEQLRRDDRARRIHPRAHAQTLANGENASDSEVPTPKPRRLQTSTQQVDETSTFALNSPSLSSPASPWASEGPSMDYGLQVLEAGLHQQMQQAVHHVKSQPAALQEDWRHGEQAPYLDSN